MVGDCRDIIIDFFFTLNSIRHPGPHNDSKLLRSLGNIHYVDCFFGFTDEEQLRAWVYDDKILTKFNEIGVTLVCYSVSICYAGNSQACAPLKEKTAENELWRISLKEFLENGAPQEIPKKDLTPESISP